MSLPELTAPLALERYWLKLIYSTRQCVESTGDEREVAAKMSPEQQDHNWEWQRQGSGYQDLHDTFDEDPPFYAEQHEMVENASLSAGAVPDDASPAYGEDAPVDDLDEGLPSRFEMLQYFRQKSAPVLVPLGIGGLLFLCVLPKLLHGSLDSFISALLVFLALGVLQGTALHYASANSGYWALGIAGGFCLFLLAACFVAFGYGVTLFLLVLLLLALGLSARKYTRLVPDGNVDIVYTFGKYSRTLLPGLNFLLPWEKLAKPLSTREKQWTCPEQHVPVSRNNEVRLKATIAYQLLPQFAYLAVGQVNNWEESLHERLENAIQEVVVDISPDDILPWSQRGRQEEAQVEASWEHINLLLFQHLRDQAAVRGVKLNWVKIRDVALAPLSRQAPAAEQRYATPAEPPPIPRQRSQAPASLRGDATVKIDGMFSPSAQEGSSSYSAGGALPRARAGAGRAQLRSEQALKNAYEQVKNGKIKSPDMIRKIAQDFEMIARDHDESKKVSFDAGLAAQRLYERADALERLAFNPNFTASEPTVERTYGYREHAYPPDPMVDDAYRRQDAYHASTPPPAERAYRQEPYPPAPKIERAPRHPTDNLLAGG